MTSDPRERLVEVALVELLRERPVLDQAPLVRARWESAQAEQRARASVLQRRPARTLAAMGAAAGLLGAFALWRATSATPPPSEPAPARATTAALPPGLVRLPPERGDLVWNPLDAPVTLRLEGGGFAELGPDAVLALDPGSLGRAGAGVALVDGSARFHAGPSEALRVVLGADDSALVLATGGRFRAEVARASGPHPVAASEGALELARPLGPTAAFVLLDAGTLERAPGLGDATAFVPGREWLGVAVEREGSVRFETRELPARSITAVAPVPGVDELPEWLDYEPWRADEAESELGELLAAEPALWVAFEREVVRRFRSHDEPRWRRGGLGVVARAGSVEADHVARRLWVLEPLWFDTDALLALAERGCEPFVAELDALLRPGVFDATTRPRGPRGSPALLALAALARGERRAAAYVARELGSLASVIATGDVSGDGGVVLLRAAVLARAGTTQAWEDAVAALTAFVAEQLAQGALDPVLPVIAALDTAAASAGIAPFQGGSAELAYFEVRQRAALTRMLRTGFGEADVRAWLERWRIR